MLAVINAFILFSMSCYSKEQTKQIASEKFTFMTNKIKGNVMVLSLDRPEKANGKTFCTGGDLDVMRGQISPHNSSIPEASKAILIADMLTGVYKPIVSKVEGDVYAGGYLFLACSTYVIAAEHLQFGLPEVKRDLFPMQVNGSIIAGNASTACLGFEHSWL